MAAVGVGVASVAACVERPLRAVPSCVHSEITYSPVLAIVPDSVDLVFVVDDSPSMAEERARLVEQLPRLVRVLLSGDRNEDGRADFVPVRSLQVGVVTSDLGAGPHAHVPGCARGLGDDGIVQTQNGTTGASCGPTHPRLHGVFGFWPGDDLDAFEAEVRCLVDVGTGGCGFEQPLEAALKALTPTTRPNWARHDYVPPRFANAEGVPYAEGGNLEGPNAGLVRPNSVLAIVLVTDEDDCSTTDYDALAAEATRPATTPREFRCPVLGDSPDGVLHPIERYVDGFLGLRGDPGMLFFAAITGVPPSLGGTFRSVFDFDALLEHPDMQVRPTADAVDIEPSCATADGVAYPPTRIVRTARSLALRGVDVALVSICSADLRTVIDGLIAKVADHLFFKCLPQPLHPDSEGLLPCDMFEYVDETGVYGPASDCASLPGRTLVQGASPEQGWSQVCRVNQVPRARIDSEPGWYYDDFSDFVRQRCPRTPQRIALTDVTPAAVGARMFIECASTMGAHQGRSTDPWCDDNNASSRNPCRLGMSCDVSADRCATGRVLPIESSPRLHCDPVAEVCAAPCASDADCQAARLPGFVCDSRTNAEAAGPARATRIPEPLRDRPRGACVHPSCR